MRRAFLAAPLLLAGCIFAEQEETKTECEPESCHDLLLRQGDRPACGTFISERCTGVTVACSALEMCGPEATCEPPSNGSARCVLPGGIVAGCEEALCGTPIEGTGEVCLNNCLRWEPDVDPRAPNAPPLPGGRFAQLLAPELDADGTQLGLISIGGRTAEDPSQPVSYFQTAEVWRLRLGADGRLTGEALAVDPPPPAAEFWIGGAGPGEVVFGLPAANGWVGSEVYRLELASLRLERLDPVDGCAVEPGCPVVDGAAGAYDPASRTLWIFGGDPADGRSETDELWSFDVAARRWTRRSEPGDGSAWPLPRRGAAAAWHPGLGRLAVFGGASFTCRCPYEDDRVTPKCALDARCSDERIGRTLTCGGDPACYASRDLRYAELWFFDPVTGRWSIAPTPSGLAPRSGAAMAWDPARGALVIAAGRGPSEGFQQACAPPARPLPGTTVLDQFNLGDTWFFVDEGAPERGSWRKLQVEDVGDPNATSAWAQCLDLAVDGRVGPLPDGTLLQMGGQLSDILDAGFKEPLVTRYQRLYGLLP